MTTIRGLDPELSLEAELDEVYELRAAAHAELNSAERFMAKEDFVAYLRLPPLSEPRRYWVALESDAIVGFGQLAPTVGSTVAQAAVFVDPRARRRRVGTALVDAACASARESGAETIVGSVGSEPGRCFATFLGATFGHRDVRSILDLQRFQPEHVRVEGYELRSWVNEAPSELVASYARAREAINDAPAATPDEWQRWDVERVRDLERVVAARGRETRVTAALSKGEVVGFTELRVSPKEGAVVTTQDTAVVSSQRGRGLGYWIKSECLRRLKDDHPQARFVATTNAESNLAILEVNRRLGFEPILVSTTCVLPMSAAAGTSRRG